ncbi:MAG: DUF6488 family protein [Pseudomonadota bacterium]
MRIQAIILSLTLYLFSLVAMAGSGHDHGHSHDPVSQSQAVEIATKNVSRLADKNKIDKSWKAIKATKSEKKDFGGHMEWVVVFNNENISDPAKQSLYIFLGLGGEYIAANHTGN